jgi:hypothetical protein
MRRAGPIERHTITPHAQFEMRRRGIDAETVEYVLSAPEQRIPVRAGRDVLQSRLAFGGVTYLIRVFVDIDCVPAEVVTVYRTSKIDKYWRADR